jgi:hypothetical protein
MDVESDIDSTDFEDRYVLLSEKKAFQHLITSRSEVFLSDPEADEIYHHDLMLNGEYVSGGCDRGICLDSCSLNLTRHTLSLVILSSVVRLSNDDCLTGQVILCSDGNSMILSHIIDESDSRTLR